jgi:hypothetical protein
MKDAAAFAVSTISMNWANGVSLEGSEVSGRSRRSVKWRRIITTGRAGGLLLI